MSGFFIILANFSEISPKSGNLVPLREKLIPLKYQIYFEFRVQNKVKTLSSYFKYEIKCFGILASHTRLNIEVAGSILSTSAFVFLYVTLCMSFATEKQKN
jgi:hypothetical protein